MCAKKVRSSDNCRQGHLLAQIQSEGRAPSALAHAARRTVLEAGAAGVRERSLLILTQEKGPRREGPLLELAELIQEVAIATVPAAESRRELTSVKTAAQTSSSGSVRYRRA